MQSIVRRKNNAKPNSPGQLSYSPGFPASSLLHIITYSSADGRPVCFHFLCIVNTAAMDVDEPVVP